MFPLTVQVPEGTVPEVSYPPLVFIPDTRNRGSIFPADLPGFPPFNFPGALSVRLINNVPQPGTNQESESITPGATQRGQGITFTIGGEPTRELRSRFQLLVGTSNYFAMEVTRTPRPALDQTVMSQFQYTQRPFSINTDRRLFLMKKNTTCSFSVDTDDFRVNQFVSQNPSFVTSSFTKNGTVKTATLTAGGTIGMAWISCHVSSDGLQQRPLLVAVID